MYCGWETRAARLRWAAVIFLLVAFASLGIMYAVTSKDCKVCEADANFVNPETGEKATLVEICKDYDGVDSLPSVEHCNKAYVVGSFTGFILSPILLLIPCFMMCCAMSPTTMAVNQRAAASRAASANPKPVAPLAAPTAAPPSKKPTGKFGLGSKASKNKAGGAPADPLSQPAF